MSGSRTCDNFGKYTVSDISPHSWIANNKLICHISEFFLDICTHFQNTTHNIIGNKLTHSNSYTERGHFSSAAFTIISLVKSPSVALLYELFYNLNEQKIPSLIVSRWALSFNCVNNESCSSPWYLSYSFTRHKNDDVANCTCKCTNSLSHTKLFKTLCNAQIKKIRTHRKRGSSILLLLAIIICDAGYREHYSRRPSSQRRLCRHRCITTLSPDVTGNELGALPSQTSHRPKPSSPAVGSPILWETESPIRARHNTDQLHLLWKTVVMIEWIITSSPYFKYNKCIVIYVLLK